MSALSELLPAALLDALRDSGRAAEGVMALVDPRESGLLLLVMNDTTFTEIIYPALARAAANADLEDEERRMYATAAFALMKGWTKLAGVRAADAVAKAKQFELSSHPAFAIDGKPFKVEDDGAARPFGKPELMS